MQTMNNLRETLDYLYEQMRNGDTTASKQIDLILTKAFPVSHLSLFLYRNNKKKFYHTLNELVLDHQISDFELGRSLASLLNHALMEMEERDMNFISLQIDEISNLLNDFLQGTISQSEVKAFFRKYLI